MLGSEVVGGRPGLGTNIVKGCDVSREERTSLMPERLASAAPVLSAPSLTISVANDCSFDPHVDECIPLAKKDQMFALRDARRPPIGL
jgi:hypothetical protein